MKLSSIPPGRVLAVLIFLVLPVWGAAPVTLAGHDEALVEMMRKWVAAYAAAHPSLPPPLVQELKAAEAGQGAKDDADAPALSPRLLRFGPTAWTISDRERAEHGRIRGRPPLELTVGLGAAAARGKPHAVGLFVHAENPLKGITLAQADAAFSSSRRRGHPAIRTWGDLGLTGEWADRPVHITGRRRDNTVSASLREVLMLGGEFRSDYRENADSRAAVAAVAGDRLALGFFGLGFAGPGVRALAVAEDPAGPFLVPGEASVAAGTYPLRRDFRLVIDWPAPGSPVDPEVLGLVRFFLGPAAQAMLSDEGFHPLPPAMRSAEQAKLDLARP